MKFKAKAILFGSGFSKVVYKEVIVYASDTATAWKLAEIKLTARYGVYAIEEVV